MPVTQRTVGHLMSYLGESTTQGTLGPLLMQHNLADGDPGSPISKSKRADAALTQALKHHKDTELLALAEAILKNQPDGAQAKPWVVDLVDALRSDGFETSTITVTTPPAGWGQYETIEIRWSITPIGLGGLPLKPLASDIADQLTAHGFTTAAGHYDQALAAFYASSWASCNSQLRTTFESVLMDVAHRRTGNRVSGGGAANDALQRNGDLPFGPNEYIRGLWKMSHPGGSHPGLSDEEDAQHRLYSVSAAVGWILRTLD